MNDYLPSSFLNEIEKPLRRDYLTEINRRQTIHWSVRTSALIILTILLGLLAYRLVMPVLAAAPAAETQVVSKDGQEISLTTLCAQYRSDHLMTGETMDKETAKACGF